MRDPHCPAQLTIPASTIGLLHRARKRVHLRPDGLSGAIPINLHFKFDRVQ
jgi:hypothetical protein